MPTIVDKVPSSFFDQPYNSKTCTVVYDNFARPIRIQYDNGYTELRDYFYDHTRKQDAIVKTVLNKRHQLVDTKII